MISKIKTLYRKFESWEDQDFYIDLGSKVIATNNATLFSFCLIIFGLLTLFLS